jgi:hypothetical protein
MKPELARHLDKARDTISEVDRIVSSHRYLNDKRTVLVVGLLGTIIQHHRGALQLIKSGIVVSSYALARDIVTGMRYGLWINACATEEQIVRVETEDVFPVSIPEMVSQVEGAYRSDPFFGNLRDRWGSHLYKYSLTGVVQLGRCDLDSASGLHFSDDEIRDVTTIATLCIVLLAAKFLARQKQTTDCEHIQALASGYANPSS